MATSQSQIKANVAYNRRHDSITLRPDKSEGARIRGAAAQAGQSVQAYILDTLRARMDRDGVPEVKQDDE